jgi:hypothetical protein
MAQLTIKNRFSQMMNYVLSSAASAPIIEYLTVGENQVYTLPHDITSIRIVSGSAWVSHQAKDVVLYRGQTMDIEQSRDIAVVTSTGRRPVELELYH